MATRRYFNCGTGWPPVSSQCKYCLVAKAVLSDQGMIRTIIFLLLSCIAPGCSVSTAVSSGHNTALDSVDLVQMTDQMARSLAREPRVAEAFEKNGPLTVVVQPVENRLTGEILPAGQAEAFTARVRSLLSQHGSGKFAWVMNRDAYYR